MRRTMALLTAVLAVAAVAEITVFVLVARWLGLPATVLLAAGTSVVGILLLRREGVRAWRRFRVSVDAGEPPGARVADGLVGLAGALLLAAPGLATDVLGALLLAPLVRPLARHGVRRVAESRMPSRLAGDVFGPRRVRARVRRGRPGAGDDRAAGTPETSGTSGTAAPGTAAGGPRPVVEGEIVEGEIVDPGERR